MARDEPLRMHRSTLDDARRLAQTRGIMTEASAMSTSTCGMREGGDIKSGICTRGVTSVIDGWIDCCVSFEQRPRHGDAAKYRSVCLGGGDMMGDVMNKV